MEKHFYFNAGFDPWAMDTCGALLKWVQVLHLGWEENRS